MSSINTQTLSQISTLQVIDNHIIVQEAAEITGYNVQYLRRLLRLGKMEAIMISQIWLINLASLQAYFSCAISSTDLLDGQVQSHAELAADGKEQDCQVGEFLRNFWHYVSLSCRFRTTCPGPGVWPGQR